MSRDEAIDILRCRKDGNAVEALEMAIRSLEAWEDVKQGIAEYIEEYGDTDANGNHCAKWCAMKEAEALINKHLKEVEE